MKGYLIYMFSTFSICNQIHPITNSGALKDHRSQSQKKNLSFQTLLGQLHFSDHNKILNIN